MNRPGINIRTYEVQLPELHSITDDDGFGRNLSDDHLSLRS